MLWFRVVRSCLYSTCQALKSLQCSFESLDCIWSWVFIWMDFERQQFIRFLDLLPRRKVPNSKNCVIIWSSQNSLH